MTIISGRSMAAQFRSIVERWHELDPPLDWALAEQAFPVDLAGWDGQVGSLGIVNCFQWHLEDACRSSYDDLVQLGELKLAIDQSNHRRVNRIDEIDRRVADELNGAGTKAPDAPGCLVTPGNVVDRLTILELKRHHSRPDARAGLNLQIADMCEGLDSLMQDLRAGRQRLVFYRTDKIYGRHG